MERSIVETPVGDIIVPTGRRVPSEESVARTMASIRTRLDRGLPGLINAVTLNQTAAGLTLVTGGTRLESYRRLKLAVIPSVIGKADPLNAELEEIDENIIRENLSAMQLGIATMRRKVILSLLTARDVPDDPADGVVLADSAKTSGAQPGNKNAEKASSDQAQAEITGETRRTVAANRRRGEELEDVAEDIVGTDLDVGTKLDALVKVPKEKRGSLVAKAKAGGKVSKKELEDAADPAKGAGRQSAAATGKQSLTKRSNKGIRDLVRWVSTFERHKDNDKALAAALPFVRKAIAAARDERPGAGEIKIK